MLLLLFRNSSRTPRNSIRTIWECGRRHSEQGVTKAMAFARSVIPKLLRLGTYTQYYEAGAQPEEVRQLYQANVESHTAWFVASSDDVRDWSKGRDEGVGMVGSCADLTPCRHRTGLPTHLPMAVLRDLKMWVVRGGR